MRKADVPQKVKDRAEIIRLSAHGWYVEKIAAHFQISESLNTYPNRNSALVNGCAGFKSLTATLVVLLALSTPTKPVVSPLAYTT
ncbi:helix-turn-helix domain-containing protein [Nostoc sp. FACHB-110]|nr:helix-turn-helix domain-containing protein [Nostoc sp. FACHB-110]